VLYAAAALIAACTAIRRPPLDALLPRLVEREELKSASALQWAIHNTASMAGPAIGGVLIATAGAAVTYTADLVTFGVSPRRARVDADAAAPGGPVARDARDRRGAVLRALAAMLPRFVAYDSRRGADAHPDVIEAM
jgi:Transmembrane secretion effector